MARNKIADRLFLDEGQRLQDELQEPNRRKIIRNVLSHLHNLETEHGFCFLVARLNQIITK